MLTISQVYSVKAYLQKSGFAPAAGTRNFFSTCFVCTQWLTAVVNLIETSLNVRPHTNCHLTSLTQPFPQLLYLYFIHVAPSNIAPLFGFSGAILTLCKTTLWVLQEYFCGRCSYSAGLTDFGETFQHWIAPNV